MADYMTNKEFEQWQATHENDLEQAARKSKEQEAENQFDPFIDEIRKVIPGSDQLSPEQLRSLANNLDMHNTRHGFQTIRSLNDAAEYTGGRDGAADRHSSDTVQGGRNQEDFEQDMIRDARNADPNSPEYQRHHVNEKHLGELSPDAGGGAGRGKEKIER